jgi:DNA-binding NtrC family response regulator
LALRSLRLPVLLRGESGTGRRHVARVLHELGSSGRELVCVSPGVPPIRSPEHRRAYLLEEVAQFPPPEQARWSELARRVEQGREDAPLRVLATSSLDLVQLARDGEFDAVFAARLLRFSLELPALRERPEDVPDLARALADRAAERIGRSRVVLSPPALRQLALQNWPGNVRELAAVIERLVAFCRGDRIARADVAAVLDDAPLSVVSSRRLRHRRQREELVALIDEAGGNLAEVARRLRMSRGGVIYRAQKFGLLPKRAG